MKFKYKHGYCKHRLYGLWCDMKKRCYNKTFKQYKDYGGRGIKVCDEWMNPKVFIDWGKSNGWERGLEIDRIDNDGNYEPDNCRFVTAQVNNCNTRLLRKDNTSGYRGVSFKNKKWVSNISINNTPIHLGYFDSKKLAAIRYDVEAYLTDERPRNFI